MANGTKDTPKIQDGLLDGLHRSGVTPHGVDARARDGRTMLQVVVEAAPGRADEVADLVRQQGGTVEVRAAGNVQARVPRAALTGLAESEAVAFVRRPVRPVPDAVTSEGLVPIGADDVHEEGYTGRNATVAVVDFGFDLANPEIADNVVAFNDVGNSSFTNRSGQHGTAVSELVVDTAPDVNLVAVEIHSATEFHQAVNWIDSQTSSDAVVFSGSWFNVGPLDGTSDMDRRLNGSIDNGTQWFTSSGNYGDGQHLNLTWRNTDGDAFLEYVGSDDCLGLPAVSSLEFVYVQWSDWPGSDNDYDLGLYNQSGTNLIATSTDAQTGSQAPTERVGILPQDGQTCLRIQNFSADGTADFDVYAPGLGMEYFTSARSIPVPGDNRRLVTVGAMDSYDGSLEPFSSRGPTIDGRRKPDLVAPDNVTTTALDPFFGTSASAPYAAGVAALLVDADPGLTPAATKSTLTGTTTFDVTAGEPNSRSGTGLLDAENATLSLSTTPPQSIEIAGRVEDAGGSPVVDDTVAAFPTVPDGDAAPRDRTNATGVFAVAAEGTTGDYELGYFQGNLSERDESFMPIDGVPDLFAVESVSGNASTDVGTVSLPSAHVLNVSVENESGTPVENARVVVTHRNATTGVEATWANERTDADGLIRPGGGSTPGIEVVGDVTVEVTPPGANSRYVDRTYTRNLTVAADGDVEFQLLERHNVSGSLATADATPAVEDFVVANAETIDEFLPFQTDANGSYSATLEGGDTYGFTFVQDNETSGTFTDRDGTADLYHFDHRAVTGDPDLGNQTIPAGHVVNVSVVDAAGAPVANASVEISPRERSFPNSTSGLLINTSAAGLVDPNADVSPGIELAGNVTIAVTPPDGESRFVDREYVRELTVTSDRFVEIELAERITVSGRVFEADGDPAANDSIFATIRDGSGSDAEFVDTDAAGAFTVPDVNASQPYHVGYYQGDFANGSNDSFMPNDGSVDMYAIRVVNATADVDLGNVTVPVGHVVNVTVENESGAPVENATVDVFHRNDATGARTGLVADTDASGRLVAGPHVGIELNGTANFTIAPPENATGFVDQSYRRNLTVTGEDNFTITLLETGGAFAVRTDAPSGVTTDAAQLNGELTGLGGASSADVQFKYWVKGDEANTSKWTSFQTLTAPGTYDATVSGLQAGTTYVARAQARDSTGNWTAGSTVEFTTAADFGVATTGSSNVTATTATLEGDLTGLGGASSADVQFKYWVQGDEANTSKWTSFQTLSSPGTFATDVTGLQANTTYVFRAQARDSSGTWTAGSTATVTTGDVYDVDTTGTQSSTDTTATFVGELNGLGDSSSVDAQFKYWVQGDEANTSKWTSFQTLTAPGSFNASVTGLQPDTTYSFRAQTRNPDGKYDAGATLQVTTATQFAVSTTGSSDVDVDSARLSGSLDSLGGTASADVQFKYWVQGQQGSTTKWTSFQTLTATGSFHANVTGLQANTTYEFRAQARDATGTWTAGTTGQFTTGSPFDAHTVGTSNLTASSATLHGNVTGLGDAASVNVTFFYWEKGNQSATIQQAGSRTLTSPGSFSADVTGLRANTTYVFHARATQPDGDRDWGANTEFTTPS